MPPEVLNSFIGLGGSLLNSLIGGSVSQGYNERNMALQAQYAKELADYQWNKFQSPQAQIRGLTAAGLSPNVFTGGKGSNGVPSVGSMPSSVPVDMSGLVDIPALSQYMLSVAQAKKAGMDTHLSEEEIHLKEVQRQRDQFELDLRKQFGKDISSVELANSYMQLVLASDQSDINELEKALKVYNIQSEKAIAKANEHQRDILKQTLDNTPLKLKLENRLTELRGNAAAAAAAESSARAKTENDLRAGRKLALDLSNELQGLENDFNYETYQKRLEQFASKVGIVKWSLLTSEMEYKDRNAYHALQRLMLGKGSKQDGFDVLKFLSNHSTDNFDLKDLQ